MKRLLLPLIILVAGTVALGRFTQLVSEARASSRRCEAEWSALSNGIVQLRADKGVLQGEVKAARERLNRFASAPILNSGLVEWLQSGHSNHWSRAPLSELRRRLGITWDSSPDYVLVSKEVLKGIPLIGTASGSGLTPTACAVLAITPDEQARLEALMQQSESAYFGWVQTNVQRIAPAGDIVAKYVIPANLSLGQRLMMEGGMGVLAAVGEERTELCKTFATEWVLRHGYLGFSSVTLTVERFSDGGQQRLQARCDTSDHGSTGWAELTPSSFPPAFRAVFPGGWPELAQRENFQLPEDFKGASPPQ